jgi:predicted XRE-type DNA-binding protein
MGRTTSPQQDPFVDELLAIKKLLVLGLLRTGASQEQIAAALGVDRSRVSRLFPGGLKLKKQLNR